MSPLDPWVTPEAMTSASPVEDEARHVEPLRHQRCVPDEEQPVGRRECARRNRRDQRCHLIRVERCQLDQAPASSRTEDDEMAAIRQKSRADRYAHEAFQRHLDRRAS